MTTILVILLVAVFVGGGPAILGYLIGQRNGYSKGIEDSCRMRSAGDAEFWKYWNPNLNNGGGFEGRRDAK